MGKRAWRVRRRGLAGAKGGGGNVVRRVVRRARGVGRGACGGILLLLYWGNR